METIKAADNLVIVVQQGVWQLNTARADDRPLLIATQGAPSLVYRPEFAEARHLPDGGGVDVSLVDEVVVGWSHTDRAWHLGLLFSESLASDRGGRWCELARWSDDFALMAADLSEKAGAALAQMINRPFRFVEAPHMRPATGRPMEDAQAYVEPPIAMASAAIDHVASDVQAAVQPDAGGDWMDRAVLASAVVEAPVEDDVIEAPDAQVASESTEIDILPETTSVVAKELALTNDLRQANVTIDQPDIPEIESDSISLVIPQKPKVISLPLVLDDWTLKSIDIGLQLERNDVWSLSNIWGVVFRLLMGIIFIVVSALALQTDLAAVKPEILPYVGLVLGVGFIVFGLRRVLKMLMTEAVVVDTDLQEVRRHRDLTSDIVEAYDFDMIQSVVVTQVLNGKIRSRLDMPDVHNHEAWLHILLKERHQPVGKERSLRPEDYYTTLIYAENVEGLAVEAHHLGSKNHRDPMLLSLEVATTPAVQAAIMLANAIGVKAYIDQR